MRSKKNRVLLFDVDGVYYCPGCFHARTGPSADETVFEITLSTVISLSAALDNPEFVCSACGKVVVEAPILWLENESAACRGILENVPDRCPCCGEDEIIAEFEELGRELIGITTLGLRRWICLTCNAAGRIEEDVTIVCSIVDGGR